VGVRVTPLKTYRHDLSAHLAAGLSAADAALGAQVNPPAVVVEASAAGYVEASGYCTDAILFDATIISKPGDPPAVADALDDMIDQVRSTLRTPSPAGYRYGFRGIGGFITVTSGDRQLPAVVVAVGIEREFA
jgi:hypothetical protein